MPEQLPLELLSRPELLKLAYAKLLLDERCKEPLWNYKPHLVQDKFHTSLARMRAFFGGNRSGKTWAGGVEAVIASTGELPFAYSNGLYKPKPISIPNEGWIVALDYPTSRDVLEPVIRKWLPSRLIKNWRQTDRIIELNNGSVISFKSVDSGWEKFQGKSLDWVWFDEEPEWTIYQECIMRLLDKKGYMWLTMTPLHGMTWTFDEVYDQADTDPDIEVFVSQIYDNKENLPQEEIARMERLFSDEEKEARLYGRFVEFAGLIYKSFRKETHVKEPFRIPANWTRYLCIDPGINNPTAVVFLAVDPDNNCYVYDEYYEVERTIAENALSIRKIMSNQKFMRQLIDPSADAREIGTLQSVRQQYMKAGIFCIPANNDVSAGISAVKELLKINEKTKKPKLFIFSNCIATIKEISRYRWAQFKHKAEDKNLREKPQKVADHAMDSLRYICADNPSYSSPYLSTEGLGNYQATSRWTGY